MIHRLKARITDHPTAIKIGQAIPEDSSFVWVLLGSLLTFWPMFQNSYPVTHSYGINISWAFQYGHQVLEGQFYPRWLEQSRGSLGSPTFSFYGPFCMVATLPFTLMGWDVVDRIVGSIYLCILMMGLGSYLYAKRLFPGSRWLWGLVAFVAMESPYFLQNIYIRGALGEMWAMAVIPWVLWAGHLCLSGWSRRWPVLILALAYGVLALCHPPSLLMFTLVWGLMPLLGASSFRQRWIWCLRYWSGAALGLWLVSFYLLPAVMDQKLVQLQWLAQPSTGQPTDHFLISGFTTWDPTLSTDPYHQELFSSFGSNLGLWILTALLLWAQGSRLSSQLRRQALILLAGSLLALVMTTDIGVYAYTHWSTLARIQFPWRWLAISGAFLPFLLGISLHMMLGLIHHPWRRRVLQTLGILGLGSLLVMTWGSNLIAIPFNPAQADAIREMFANRIEFPDEADLDAKPFQAVNGGFWETATGELVLFDVAEYIPTWVTYQPTANLPDRPLIQWDKGSGTLSDIEWQVGSRRFGVNSEEEDGLLTLRMVAWPGWEVRLNGDPLPLFHQERSGLLQIPLSSPGDYEVTVRYRGTMSERYGWLNSFIALTLGLVWWQWPWLKRRAQGIKWGSRQDPTPSTIA